MKSITSLYIHFPFCQHLCNYCDFYKKILLAEEQVLKFEELLLRQIDYQQIFLNKNGFELKALDTLYIGGGTPSLWKKGGTRFLRKLFREQVLLLREGVEFTIEVDPNTWTEEEIDAWIEIGVNRFSIGAQSFSDKYIKVMDRVHSLGDVTKTVKYFHERGLNYSVDLMLGLPYSTERNLLNELEGLLRYSPNHLSVYILKTRKNYPLSLYLPEDEQVREEYLFVSKFLQGEGYDHYEVSSFSRDGFYSQHNLKYWNYKSVAALGPNGTGLIVGEDMALRYQWKSVSLGVEKEELSGTSLVMEKLFLGLRYRNDFNLNNFFPSQSEKEVLDKLYASWGNLGYLKSSSHREGIHLNSLGFLMCDSILDDILKHLDF